MTLAEEAQRYLAVVEFFRAHGAEPHWRREPAVGRIPQHRPAAVSLQVPERKKRCDW